MDEDQHGEVGSDDAPAARPPIFMRDHVPHLLTIEHAASVLDVSERTVRRLLDEGELRRVRIGANVVRVRADDLAALISRRTEETARDADLPEPDRQPRDMGVA